MAIDPIQVRKQLLGATGRVWVVDVQAQQATEGFGERPKKHATGAFVLRSSRCASRLTGQGGGLSASIGLERYGAPSDLCAHAPYGVRWVVLVSTRLGER